MMGRFQTAFSNGIFRITFDDGGMNLLSRDAIVELRALIANLPDETRLVTFRSGRHGIFAAGADMREMKGFSSDAAEKFAEAGQELFLMIERAAVVTVAWIEGDCFGGALDLALAFDFRFAHTAARFSHPGSKIGIATGFGGTTRWSKVMTRTVAATLFLSSPILQADRALKIGLVDRVIGRFDREEEDEFACTLASPARVRFAKELLAHSQSPGSADTQLLARRLAALHSEDAGRGI